MKVYLLFFLVVAALGQSAFSQPQCDVDALDWSTAKTVSVFLEWFHFYPKHTALEWCKPYKIRLVNNSKKIPLNFTAPDFFASAKVRNPDTGLVSTPSYQKIELAPLTEIDLLLVPTEQGDFSVRCTHPFHSTLGMKGSIYVGP